MVNRAALLSDLQRLLRTLEADLLQRSDGMPEVKASLEGEYQRAREAQRTAQGYEEWRSDYTTQVAAAWVLSCVFVRFLEDNRLIDPPRIAGPGERLARARDEHEMHFSAHPTETDREYLLAVFDELAGLPGTRDVFGPHNAVRELPNWPSGDAAGELLRFFQRIDADTGTLVHDFTDPDWDTRFLGDLYQDLSEAARKKYALLQTPEFVEEFILDRTLDPALDEFGLTPLPSPARGRGVGGEGVSASDNLFRMIDPACGSGHFLLGAFRRIFDRWCREDPGAKCREVAQRTLDSIYGVDLNPFAVAIARFRLLLAALKACGVLRLAHAPAFRVNLACGDSLLHGTPSDQLVFRFDPLAHVYQSEDLPELRRILKPGHYHAVVANPPYITPKDKALNQAYREGYSTCHRQYSLAVPFMQRLFTLAVAAGYVGQITANSFMKREFGKKIIEEFLPKVDLNAVIDTSGAYVPGHGTPTVILFARNRRPLGGRIRTAMGIRGEPSTPENAAHGLVWSAILDQIDRPGSESEFVSVADSPRESFQKHPWSVGGGGASELKDALDAVGEAKLGDIVSSIGFFQDTHADEAFVQPVGFAARHSVQEGFKPQIRGDNIRDWCGISDEEILFPYDENLAQWPEIPLSPNWSWLYDLKTELWSRSTFGGGTYRTAGRPWCDYHQFPKDRARTPLSIVFAFVATHNHFVLDRGGKVFNRSAPVVKLPAGASEDDHLALLGLLNSSTACFWMKQVFYDKGSTVDSHGARQTTVAFENFREFTATGLLKFPVPAQRPLTLARRLDEMAGLLAEVSPSALLRGNVAEHSAQVLAERQFQWEAIRRQMIALQEELDWQCYRLYGLVEEDLTLDTLTPNPSPANGRGEQRALTRNPSPANGRAEEEKTPPGIELGQRAFEIVMARKMAAGELETTWFERHGSTPITEIPDDWPDDYRRLVERRIALIQSDRNIALIEQPEYKRRWNTEPWESQLDRALRTWLLDRLETHFDFDGRMNDEGTRTAQLDVAVVSVGRLAQVARRDGDFLEVGALYRDDPAFDVLRLVAELVEAESVPLLPVLRYKPSGLRKRAEWEKTWELQRREDAIDARTKLPPDDPEHLDESGARDVKRREVGEIPVPPKYTSSDFLPGPYWRLRGKLDVPKERWVSFPYCEGEDGTLVIAWAGYDHLQLAKATSAYFVEVQERLGGRDDPRLVPLLACLVELLPWIKQVAQRARPGLRRHAHGRLLRGLPPGRGPADGQDTGRNPSVAGAPPKPAPAKNKQVTPPQPERGRSP